MSRTWEQLEVLKEEALQNDQMNHALFWQNEQLLTKLNNITWFMREVERGHVQFR